MLSWQTVLFEYVVLLLWLVAVFVSLRSILMVELMGLERLTSAFGLVTMFQGLSTFIGAPIAGARLYYSTDHCYSLTMRKLRQWFFKLAGALKDATGSYTYSFYMAGATLALAGVICFPLRRINGCLKRRNTDAENGDAWRKEKPTKQHSILLLTPSL